MEGEDRAQASDLATPPATPVVAEPERARPSGPVAGGAAVVPAPPEGAAPAPAPAPTLPSGRTTLSREKLAAMDALFARVARAPESYDFYQVLRRLESLYCDRPERPRLGAASRPADEPVRLGQDPSLAFAPRVLAGLFPGKHGAPPRLAVNFFGLLGPNGPLPLHLTEYARERERHVEDSTMARFFDLFHHRMMLLFYRAWSTAQPTVGHDHPASNRFVTYVGAMAGLGLPTLRGRDDLPDAAKFFYAGHFGAQTKHAEGLEAMVGQFFQMPAQVEPFMGSWLEIPTGHQWRLGTPGVQGGALGGSTIAGRHVWSRQQKFRVTLGPLNRGQFQRMLPGGASLKRLTALVRNYASDEHLWDLRLVLDEQTEEPCRLGKSLLGWTSWLGKPKIGRREDLILDPMAEVHQTSQQAAA
jgi:type VI secretion system protein ImpH